MTAGEVLEWPGVRPDHLLVTTVHPDHCGWTTVHVKNFPVFIIYFKALCGLVKVKGPAAF